MASNGIPRIDIAPMLAGDPVGKRRIAEQVRDALETIGFFTIVGHGVPDVVVRDARDSAYEFFSLPLAEKMHIPRPGKVATRGYDPPANQRLAATHGNDTPPDLQELFGMGEFDLPDDPYYTERVTARTSSRPTCGRNARHGCGRPSRPTTGHCAASATS